MVHPNSEASSETTVEHWSTDTISLRVEQPKKGFWNSISLWARIPIPPKEVFEILTDPDNSKYFRSIKAVKGRKVVKDDGHGRQEVEVDQIGRWRFGPFKGTFSVKLVVIQDLKHGTIDFRLSPCNKSFMKSFNGGWTIRPYNEDSLDEMVRHPGRHWGPFHSMKKMLHQVEDKVAGRHVEASLVELRQAVAPTILPPPPLDKVLKKITVAQVKAIMQDLLNEADNRNAQRHKEAERAAKAAADPKRLEAHVRRLTQ